MEIRLTETQHLVVAVLVRVELLQLEAALVEELLLLFLLMEPLQWLPLQLGLQQWPQHHQQQRDPQLQDQLLAEPERQLETEQSVPKGLVVPQMSFHH